MASFEKFFPHCISLLSLPLLFSLVGLGFQGCAPLDQRTFDPNAGKPPQVHVTQPMPPKKQPPFLQVVEGTPESDYAGPIEKATKIALNRKPNVLFIVQGIAPMQNTPDKQAQTLNNLTQHLAVPVTNHIVAAGARPVQIDMRVATDPTAHQAMVRINVR